MSAERIFRAFATPRWRRPIFFGAALMVALALAALPFLKRDTTITAFLPKQNPAIVHTHQVSEIFRQRPPIVVAVLAPQGQDIFEPGTLADVAWLTEMLKNTPNIDPETVRSLSTASLIGGEGDQLLIDPVMADVPQTPQAAADVGHRARAMPHYAGLLYARDGSAALISASLIDQEKAGKTYDSILHRVSAAPAPREIHVAGIGAASGYLSAYLSKDSLRMVPLSLIAAVVVMVFAFRTTVGVVLPFLIVAPSVLATIAVMAVFKIPYFVISNALPPILIAMAVTDALHIMSFYYREQARMPTMQRGRLAARAIMQVWRPITLTEFTVVIGFFGNAASASSPPMIWFSLFAMLGVTFAYFVSLALIPGGLAIWGGTPSPLFQREAETRAQDVYTKCVAALSGAACRHPLITVALAGLVAVAGVAGIARIQVDSNLMDQFRKDEPIAIADRVVNERFGGTNNLDVVFDAKTPEGMLDPERMAKVEQLAAYLATLPHVGAVTSIVDDLKQLNQALHGNDPAAHKLPDSAEAIAQELFLLSASRNPAEWSDRIDGAQQRVLLRAYFNSGHYSDGRPVVEAVRQYVGDHLRSNDLDVNLAGSLVIADSWLGSLGHEHVWSVAIALFLVFVVDALLFRSVFLGLLTLTPVLAAIMLIYSAMGFMGVPLDAATSMFAAISIGLGVDFAIHTVNWITRYMETDGCSVDEAVQRMAPASGRAQFLNFAIFFAAFGIVGFSELPTIQRFGGLVALAILASFISALTLIPAIMKLLNYNPSRSADLGGSLAAPPLQRS